MRLETVHVQNFRSCYDTSISLAGDLTLLVGENDAGKSNLIDAIRLSVPPVSGRTTRWFETDRDLSYGVHLNVPIVIKRTYGELTDSEDAFYTPALVDPHRKLVHTTHYLTDPRLARRHRLHHSVGENLCRGSRAGKSGSHRACLPSATAGRSDSLGLGRRKPLGRHLPSNRYGDGDRRV